MADNVQITAGSGTSIATDDVGGIQFQKVKLDLGGDGATVPATGDGTNGLDVDVTRVQGSVTVVQATPTNLKVDASGVAVPVTDNSSSLTVDAPVGTPVFVRLSDGAAPITALPVTDNSSTLSVDDGAGSLTVDGSVTANQGTPAAVASAWPVKISDGSTSVGISDVSGAKAIKADLIQSVALTANQGTAHASENWRVNLAQILGAAISETNPLYVLPSKLKKTPVRKSFTYSASQTDQSVWTPTAGKKFVIESIIISVGTGGAGQLQIFDGSNAAANMIADMTLPNSHQIQLRFEGGHPSSTANNVLRYTTGTGAAGTVTIFGYETD